MYVFRWLVWLQLSAHVSQYGTIGIIIYPILMLFAKISILLLYYRLFKPNKVTSKIVWATIALVVAYNIAIILTYTFLCIPSKGNMDMLKGGQCARVDRDTGDARQTSPAIVSSAFNVFTDVIILVLPMPTVWKLQLPIRQRIAVMGIFATGALYVMVRPCFTGGSSC